MATKKEKNAPLKKDFWEALPANKKHIACLGFLFLLPFILYFSSTLGGKQYMGHDAIQWRAGAESLIEHREEFGEPAHWATNMFSGMPAITISHPPQVWNLDTILKSLSFIYPALEYWIILGGAYLMFILMGFRPLASVFGAIVIGFSTYIPIIIGAGHNAKFIAYIYIPWLYAGYFLITRSDLNRWLAFFLFALALTLHLRSYHPQVTYFFLFPLATLFLYDLWKSKKNETTSAFLKQTGLLIGAMVLALAITFQLYLSTAEYSPYSMRGGSEVENTEGLSQDYAFAWSQGVGELLTLAIPGSYGGASSDAYWGPKSFTSGPHYMGALTFLFFIIGLIKSRHHLKWVFFAPGVATLLFSLGENFYLLNNAMFSYFPLFNKFRAPEMWLMVSVFCFAVVAVMGLEWSFQQLKQKSSEWKKAAAIAGGIGLVFVFIGFQMLSFEKPGERTQLAQQIARQNQVSPDDPRVTQTVQRYINNELIPTRKELAQSDTIRFAFMFAAGIILLWLTGVSKVSPSVSLGLIALIIAFDMIRVDKRYLSENSLTDASMSREQHIERQESELDNFISANNVDGGLWEYRALPLLSNPFNNAIPSYFYPSAGGYSGAKLGYYQDLIDEAFFTGPAGLNQGVFNMLNIKYLTAQGSLNLPGFETVLQTGQGAVLENTEVLPKAWFVDSVESLPDHTSILQELKENFNARSTAYITGRLSEPVQKDSLASVRVTEYNANKISLDISRSQPGFLVLSEIWYPPGWSATLNGSEIDIIRTNYVLRGFEIFPGDHELVMTLDPSWYETGNWMSAGGTVLLFGAGLFGILIFVRKKNVF